MNIQYSPDCFDQPVSEGRYRTRPGGFVIYETKTGFDAFSDWQQQEYRNLDQEKQSYVSPRKVNSLQTAVANGGVLYNALDQQTGVRIATALGCKVTDVSNLNTVLNIQIKAGECSYYDKPHIVINSMMVGAPFRKQGLAQAMFAAALAEFGLGFSAFCVATENKPAILAAFKAGYVITALGRHNSIGRDVYIFSQAAHAPIFISDRVVNLTQEFGWLEMQNLLDAGFCITAYNSMMNQIWLAVHPKAQRQQQAA